MTKKRKSIHTVPVSTSNLPEENRQEISNLISYINNVLLFRIDELSEELSRLKKGSVQKFKLDISDDENE